ncbi:low temperature requirement protein A [Diaminobutyricibacter sp. McL0618]|uniref:low temperature requirement protein A n=1 Tax=Leifsonia sp. McL0618 TaxID=3415677 RepID=UPI003CEE430E
MTEQAERAPRERLGHGLARMSGRDPAELHRASTPLELLFDLAFVVAFGQAADQLAHLLGEGHVAVGLGAFAFAMVAACWAWINFSWFASAYDTDDWFYRTTTMVQMIGVIVFALGIPAFFASVDGGHGVNNGVMVAGYVVMRVALVVQWCRVAVQDPVHRTAALTYAGFVSVAQVGWVLVAFADLPLGVVIIAAPVVFVIELAGPAVIETRLGGTPWHPHHIAERYGLLTIIALGEVLFGTVASVTALVGEQGWSMEAVIVVVAGIGLVFGLWWTYFILPAGPILSRHRRRAVVWGYSHVFIYAAIAATGAGLHVSAFVIEGTTDIGTLGATLAVAIPVLVFSIALFLLYTYLVHQGDPFHVLLFAGTVLLLVAAVVVAAAGGSIGTCLILVTLSPAVVVVGFETVGHRHEAVALARTLR